MRRLLSLALLLAVPASAQIALVSHALIPNSASTSAAIDTTGANMIAFCSSGFAPYATAAPTDSKGNTWILVKRATGSYAIASLWVTFNPTVGAGHTFTSNDTYGGGAVAAYSGVASGPDQVDAGIFDANSPQATGAMTPSQADELVFSCLAATSGGTLPTTIGSPMTAVDASSTYGYPGNTGASTAQQIQGGTAAAVNPTWTIATGQMAAASATFFSTLAPAPLTINTGNPPEGFVGTAYSYTLPANGGVSPFTWALTSGTLPSGISLSSSGVLSSSGNIAAASTTTGLVFKVTDSQSHTYTAAAKTLTLAAAPLSFPTTCPGGTQLAAYAGCSVAGSGGTAPYSYAWLTDPAHVGLPEGLTLNTATGAISGSLTGQGEYDTTFTMTDATGAVLTQTIPFHIAGNNTPAAALFFPVDHFLHGYDISRLPVDTSPAAPPSLPGTVQMVGGHSVVNGGIPLNYVPGTQPYIPINCTSPCYVSGATSGPFTLSTAVEATVNSYAGGADAHGIVVQAANGSQPAKLFNTWRSFPSTGPTAWNAVSTDVWDLTAYSWVNGQVGADAAGLPIGAMIPTYDEVMSPGGYKRLTRMAFASGNQFDYWVWPAQSTSPGYGGAGACSGGFVDTSGNGNHLLSQSNPPTSCGTGPSQRIPLGEIYRLKASYTLPACATNTTTNPQASSLAHSWQTVGGINADEGSFPQYILTADDRWNDADLACLNQIPGSAWEPVNVGSLIRYDGNGYPLSMQVKGATTARPPVSFGNVIVGALTKPPCSPCVRHRFRATLRSMNSPFPWPGGKRALCSTLARLLPPHHLYVEVFAGSAKLLFGKQPSAFEVMNDLNGEITNFFRVAKHRPSELAERLELECIHAGRFRELLKETVAVCEIDRALRFAYLVWYSFGGKGEHFGGSSAKNASTKRPLSRVRDLLQQIAERLHRVQIEQRDCLDILDRYDGQDTVFYLDPPYVHFQSNGRYSALGEEKRAALFARLAAAKGRFLMSFDDCPEVRALAVEHAFQVTEVQVPYTIMGPGHSGLPKARELLLANYPIDPTAPVANRRKASSNPRLVAENRAARRSLHDGSRMNGYLPCFWPWQLN